MSNNSTFVFVRNDFEDGAIITVDPESLFDKIDETLESVLHQVEAKIPNISDNAVRKILEFAACR